MDDFSENQEGLGEGESTVFSAPAEHKGENIKSPKKRKILAVIAAALAVLILVGGTIAIIKLIPEKDDKDNTSSEQTVSVINFDKSKFDSVKVKNPNGEFVLLPEKGTDDTIKWYLEGISVDKISADLGIPIFKVLSALTLLEVRRLVKSEPGRYFSVT